MKVYQRQILREKEDGIERMAFTISYETTVNCIDLSLTLLTDRRSERVFWSENSVTPTRPPVVPTFWPIFTVETTTGGCTSGRRVDGSSPRDYVRRPTDVRVDRPRSLFYSSCPSFIYIKIPLVTEDYPTKRLKNIENKNKKKSFKETVVRFWSHPCPFDLLTSSLLFREKESGHLSSTPLSETLLATSPTERRTYRTPTTEHPRPSVLEVKRLLVVNTDLGHLQVLKGL